MKKRGHSLIDELALFGFVMILALLLEGFGFL